MKDNNELPWWIPGSDPYPERHTKIKEERKLENSQEQFTVNFCTICETAYQHSWDGHSSKSFYFRDFPTYGLKRRKCEKCK